jgi:hypothetical protein
LRARQKVFLANIVSSVTWDIIQLDYSSAPDDPTLRQMIMALTTRDNDIPLFHCVDLDWKGEGYIFQYSPSIKVEAECTINTLLPLLKFKYPGIDIEKYFSTEAIERCEGYAFDPAKGIVVDKLIDDNLTFIDEENLLGFALDANEEDNESNADVERPTRPQPLYHDNDSVSTLAKPGKTSYIRPTLTTNVSFTRNEPRSSDNTSVTSGTSTVTMDTVNSIIDTRFTEITAHIRNNEKKFDALMEILRTQNAGGQASSPDSQTSTTEASSSKAGEDNASISGRVP